mmetsp:Transcript_22678/g.31580  ORF Transcript_22678/g.31580 Transcript_22678/m.31580 type:complete len:120 (-) Transcript_22678:74-433(-)|eukprot:CAMPEP_0168555166 /NCGR_PEP_ID=MMETSP0413-20121227/8179_1 /TAXON_ID=136452 /ORGANISM="Filamoeba nolandi, Strain NC-AS-23-1" /LENGTH=119 /DNA_ID=CAMNT_0008585977 /DNA_START=36 /DNA_END=395 /DNA_ORIENTATION=-
MSGKKSKKEKIDYSEEEEEDEDYSAEEEEPKKGAAKGKKRKAEDEPSKDAIISLDKFKKEAKDLKIVINGTEFTAEPKEFSSGSYGWGLAGKVLKVKVGDQDVHVQLSINLPIRGSKKK